MNLTLKPSTQKQIDRRVKSGKYHTAEDLISTALMSLEQQERFGDLQPGELDRLLNEGEKSIKTRDTLDGQTAFEKRRARLKR